MNQEMLRSAVGILLSLCFTWACTASESGVSDDTEVSAPEDVSDPADFSDDDSTSPDLTSVYEKNRILDVQVQIEEEDWNQLRFERRSMTTIFGSNCEQGLGLGQDQLLYNLRQKRSV